MITGANSGIGKVTAEELYARGARVVMLCRSEERAAAAVADIQRRRKGKGEGRVGTLEVERVDLGSLESVRECARAILKKLDRIDVLINNAGTSVCPAFLLNLSVC